MSAATSRVISHQDHPTKNIRWGIIGLGDVTQIKSGPPFWKCQGSELVAVMRRTPGKAQEFAQRVPTTTTNGNRCCVGYDNVQEFLQHPGLEAVYICTRPGSHLAMAELVAAAGKACYIEKPVGRCSAETLQIMQLFQSKQLPLYTAYISRAYPRTQALRELRQNGAIGEKISKISYRLVGTGGARNIETSGPSTIPWRLDPKQSGGGLIMDVGCHILDRIDYLCGPLIKVHGNVENRNSPNNIAVEDYVSLTAEIGLRLEKDNPYTVGAKVECTWDFASDDEPCDEFIFTGTHGSIQMAGMSPDGPIHVLDTTGNILHTISFETPEHTAQAMVQAVTDDLRGIRRSTKEYLSFGDNALRTPQVLDQGLESNY